MEGSVSKMAIPTDLSEIVVTRDDPSWEEARRPFNLEIDQRPELIALPRNAAEVAAVVRFAVEQGLGVAPQGTGHGAAGVDPLDDAVLLKTVSMRGVTVDRDQRIARVEGGAQWGDIVPMAAAHGLAALHGTAADVTVAGYSLGGGIGWYSRKYGLAANRVTAVELVDADGELRRASAEENTDLFWAVRGGGGNFGVATAIEFELLQLPELYAGALFFPMERGAEVLHAWRELTQTAPREMASLWRTLRFPPVPEVPEPLRGGSFAIVEAVLIGSQAEGDELLAPLRELGPLTDTFATSAPDAIPALHMDPPVPMPVLSTHALLADLPAPTIDRLMALLDGGAADALRGFEVRHTGGALQTAPEGAGALAAIPGLFSTAGGAPPESEAHRAALEEGFTAIHEALRGDEVGLLTNFTSSPGTDPARFFGQGTAERLAQIRGRVDPAGVFRAAHPIAPAA